MRATRSAVVVLLLAAPASLLAGDEQRAGHFVRLLDEAGRGLTPVEEAAWLVRDGDGREQLVRWPTSGLRRGQAWSGVVPGAAVALLHTHPSDGSPRPSEQDRRLARRLGLPVYTISVWGVLRADPDGSVVDVSPRAFRPSIDWALARGEPPVARPGNATAGGSSGPPFPELEPAVR